MIKKKNIFVVEDDMITSMLIKRVLLKHPIINNINTFSNGKEAFYFFNQLRKDEYPDLIFLDLNMPVMDGWEFLDCSLKYMKINDIPIVILSSSIDPNDRKKAIEYNNIIRFLSKPLRLDEVNDILNDL
jgi:CheY-like chemotaxis protein